MEEDDLRKGPRWRKRPIVRYNISSAPPQSASMPPAPSASRYSFSSASPHFLSAPPQFASMPPAPSASRNDQWKSPIFQPAFEESATFPQSPSSVAAVDVPVADISFSSAAFMNAHTSAATTILLMPYPSCAASLTNI
ncbi:hypothetical protein AMTRI_Chr04g186640 [Amborella trichopoda]